MARVCKDGRIWGQNNKEAGSHLGILTGRKTSDKLGFNPKSIGRPFKSGQTAWNKGKKGLQRAWNKGLGRPALYSSEFLYKLRELIRERDGYKCQLCGCPQAECGEALSIHHIDYSKTNDSHTNLVSLCRHCHLKTNSKNKEYWIERFSWLRPQS